MQKYSNRTSAMLMKTEAEVFDALIPSDHPFRQLNDLIDFSELIAPLRSLYSELGTTGIDVEKGVRALLIQFWEDYSDRQMEKCLRENMAVKFFCGFGVLEATPAHTYFTKLRSRLGARNIANLFHGVNTLLRNKGLFGDVFTFIDASTIVTKTALWEERDKAIKEGEEKLNNANVKNYAADPDAGWGCKGKDKIWFGYKRHHAVDMRFGLVKTVAATPANVPDFRMFKRLCPNQGMVFMDKGYDYGEVDFYLQMNRCASGVIRKNDNRKKNPDLDGYRSRTRMPFEGTFSKLNHRARYRGTVKVLFQCFAEALCHNLKKAISIFATAPPPQI